MAATAGTLTLIGVSGRTYTVDLYIPDATGTYLTFNAAGLAASTSQAQFRIPENCTIYDISAVASPTAVGATFQNNSGVINGGTIRWANQLQTLPNRQKLNVRLNAGDIIQMLQF